MGRPAIEVSREQACGEAALRANFAQPAQQQLRLDAAFAVALFCALFWMTALYVVATLAGEEISLSALGATGACILVFLHSVCSRVMAPAN